MKLRSTAIAAALSLIPIGQPLIVSTGAALTTSALLLSVPEKAKAESAEFYFNRAYKKGEEGDHYGAISDYTKVIEINPNNADAFASRNSPKFKIGDQKGSCFDSKKAAALGYQPSIDYLASIKGAWCRNLSD